MQKTPKAELKNRLAKVRGSLTLHDENWRFAAITSKINMFYLTGTIADGVLVIERGGEDIFWVRRSFDRAALESEIENIKPYNSFREVAEYYRGMGGDIYLEGATVSLDWWKIFTKYLPFEGYKNIDLILKRSRAVKSDYELGFMKRSGEIHSQLLVNILPTLLKEGMSEAELGTEIYSRAIALGHHGVSRFSMDYAETILGHICFGDSSLFPSPFDGASGTAGLSAAVPALGSRERFLKHGDYVYVDIAVGVEGYHTDKTRIYKFGGKIDREVMTAQERCIDIQRRIADLLTENAVPEEIYYKIWNGLTDDFKINFMGYGSHQVKFLGHGVGLFVDEYPVIAAKFTEKLQKNMTLAIEPKKSIGDLGMFGVEDTYLVTGSGGVRLTGDDSGEIMVVRL